MKRRFRSILLILAFGTLLPTSHAENTDRKVAGIIPLSQFSPNHQYTFDDIVRISLLVNNHDLTNVTTISDADLEAMLSDAKSDAGKRKETTVKYFGTLERKPSAEEQLGLAQNAAIAITINQTAPYQESILSDENIGYTPAPPPWVQHTQQFFKTHFRLRQSWDQLALVNTGTNVNSALISYTRNIKDKNNIWSAVGAIGYEQLLLSNTLTTVELLPNAAFDRVTGNTTNDADSLVFRVPFVYNQYGDNHWVQSQSIRLTPLYATDFKFRSSQAGGELEWEPLVARNFYLGNGIVLPGPGLGHEYILLFPRAFIHFEGGSVLEAGNNPKLVQGQSFFRAGPVVQLKIKAGRDLPSLKNVALTAGWQEYESLRSGTEATRLFTAGAAYKLSDNLDLEFQYRDGRIALTAQKVQTLMVGLGLKF